MNTKTLLIVLVIIILGGAALFGWKKKGASADSGQPSILVQATLANFPVEDVVGRWSGNFDGNLTPDEHSEMDLTFDKSGGLTISDGHFFGKKRQCRWKITGSNTVDLTFEDRGNTAAVSTSIPLTYQNGTLVLMNGHAFHKM